MIAKEFAKFSDSIKSMGSQGLSQKEFDEGTRLRHIQLLFIKLITSYNQ